MDLEAAVIARDDAIDITEQHQAGEVDSVPNTCLTCRKPGVLLYVFIFLSPPSLSGVLI